MRDYVMGVPCGPSFPISDAPTVAVREMIAAYPNWEDSGRQPDVSNEAFLERLRLELFIRENGLR